ncbi:hypothetical protein F4802DRAFT_603098 [Xylaria palmicola]|nr:hypothetical protein F4802DRAFT_603098 [Xylaria palmicola]
MAPTIFGVGSGLFNKHSIQIPALVAAALAHGRAVVFGDGEGVWDHVHVQDLAALYEILALRALDDNDDDDEAAAAREDLPRGKKGIVFAGAGRHSWNDVARGVARAAHAAGALPDTRVDRLGVAGAVRVLAAAFPLMAHEVIVDLGLASNVRTVATVARRLGWRPARGEEAWEQGFREEVDHALRERREKGR